MVFKLARKIPAISQRIEREMIKINETFEQEVIHRNEGNPYITTLPKEGKTHDDIIQQVERYLSFGMLVDCKIRNAVLLEESL